MKALILEDDPSVQALLVNCFHSRGYDVVTYFDPSICPVFLIDSCSCQNTEYCFNVIISDYEMPHVNGVEFIETMLRKGCKCPNIALMSGCSIPKGVLERASKLKIKFFAKPFHRSQINNWLNQIESDPALPVEDDPAMQ